MSFDLTDLQESYLTRLGRSRERRAVVDYLLELGARDRTGELNRVALAISRGEHLDDARLK